MKRNKKNISVAFQKQSRQSNDTKSTPRRTRQADIGAALEPWLNLAVVLPPDQPVPSPEAASEEIIETFREAGAYHAMKGLLANYSPNPGPLVAPREEVVAWRERGKEYYRLFFNVRSAIEFIALQASVSIDRGESPAPRPSHHEQLPKVELHSSGSLAADFGQLLSHFPQRQLHIYRPATVFVLDKIGFVDDPYWGAFRKAMEAADPRRFKRCPVCSRFYYAVRKNTGACNEHQSLARVRKARQKTDDYNASRRLRRKIGGKGVRGKERKRLVELSEALRGRDKE